MAAARSPALAASALLHGGLVLAALLSFRRLQQEPPPPPPPPVGESVPVSITTAAPVADVRPAVAAPKAAPPPSEAPEPAPAPPPPAESPAPPARPVPAPPPRPPPRPAPRPTPAPPVETPAPPPRPRPAPVARPKPLPAKPAPRLDLDALARRLPAERRPARELDLSALAASLPRDAARPPQPAGLNLDALAASLPAGGRRAAAAQRGPGRAETALQARPAVGAATGLSADARAALRAKLIRLWTLDCEVEGADTVVARVRIRIGPDGDLSGAPELVSTSGDASAGVKSAAGQRALSAVQRGAPYTEVPAAQRATLNDFVLNFDARQACRNR